MRYSLTIVCLLLFYIVNAQSKISGIWIPKKINWKEGTFKTFCFGDNNSFVLISSTQNKIKDSIYFQSEPGYTLSECNILYNRTGKIIFELRTFYKFIVMPGEKIPGSFIKDSIKLKTRGSVVNSFDFRGITYEKTKKYTKKSVNAIYAIKNRIIPAFKKNLIMK